MRPTWKDIIKPYNFFGHVSKFFEKIVYPSGYNYFEWNDRIFKVNGKSFDPTEFISQDIE